ncbi:hypothetical protein ACS0TY_025525 [Phlomoides rotata]
MAGINNSNEPSTAPQADRWYNLTLGSSFKDNNPSKFCTFRYEFKPASIDKNQRGTLHKNKDNKVTVGFQNIQPGKPKVNFEGTSEDYKDNDAVLFFDGESFRLERLHRAVKRLRHNRMMGESTGAGPASVGLSEANSPPVGKAIKHQPLNKDTFHPVSVEVERIDIGDFKSSDAKPRADKNIIEAQANSGNPSPPEQKNDEQEEDFDLELDIMNDDEDDDGNAAGGGGGGIEVKELDIDINIPHQNYTDDEIADVDVSDDEGGKGPNAAEALRAQVGAEKEKGGSSSSSSSSGSSSGTGSGSGSSSSDSDSSDADSVSSV